MKCILTLFSFLLFTSFSQEVKLKGTYKAEFEQYFDNDGYVDFLENNFKWRPFRFLPFQGEIEYSKNYIHLKTKSNLIYSIRYENIKKDTIPFYVYDLDGKGSYMDIAIGKGKLIKTE